MEGVRRRNGTSGDKESKQNQTKLEKKEKQLNDNLDTELDYVDKIYTKIQGNSWFYWFIALPVGFAYCHSYSRLMPFLILMPKLICSFNGSSDWLSCTEKEACSNPQTLFKIDYTSEDTVSNWITELNLVCLSKFNIGLFGSLYFVGYVIGALTFVRNIYFYC